MDYEARAAQHPRPLNITNAEPAAALEADRLPGASMTLSGSLNLHGEIPPLKSAALGTISLFGQ
ncbi:hypothetical protein ACFROC_20475 [Nocardia tengchongensis]|uniref:hypothetical protein n=1 Tax=Nocardia tengchongensis TaxID=2055889 RepID=UPI0036A633E3